MAESRKQILNPITLRFSPALYTQLLLAARNAGKPLESTIKSLLWIGLGALQLKSKQWGNDPASHPMPTPKDP
jgi:hypothetical protein